MGLGRVYDPRFAAVSGGRAQCGADLQLVELVCTLCPAATGTGGGDQPAIVVMRRGTRHREWASNDPATDQHPCEGGPGASLVDQSELVFKWVEECCGAVEFQP